MSKFQVFSDKDYSLKATLVINNCGTIRKRVGHAVPSLWSLSFAKARVGIAGLHRLNRSRFLQRITFMWLNDCSFYVFWHYGVQPKTFPFRSNA